MNLLDRSLIEKTANEHGWENVLKSTSAEIILSSARHQAHARITPDQHFTRWLVELPSGLHQRELSRSFPLLPKQGTLFGIDNYEQLASLLQRSAELATSLPNQAALIFAQKVKQELSEITSFSTEVERVVKQRVGQDTFRQALLNYWEGTCAVTGINLPEILRASHAKPWAERHATDEERLNVFNGLLLSANLDALFDRGLISFAENGDLICSSRLKAHQRLSLHLNANQKLRWISPAHEPFLSWHRSNLFQR